MTVQEAYKTCFGKPYIVPIEEHNEAKGVIKQALEEVEQYRTLGTVEELKEAREKQVAKKPIRYEKTARVDCPVCGNTVAGISGSFGDYCSKCGNKMDWGEEDD